MQNDDELLSKLTALSDTLPDPIFILDYEGTYLAALGGNHRLHYDTPQTLVGRRLQDVLPEEKCQLFLGVVRKSIDSGTLQTCEYQMSSSDVEGIEHDGPSEPQWFQGRVFPLPEAPERTPAVLWLVINITEQKKRERHLKILTEIDDLTGVYNRRYFMTKLKNEFERDRRQGLGLALISFDVDHFKSINDNYGHDAGDCALQRLTQALDSHLRTGDVLARVGGEEFAVICPDTSLAGAGTLAERLRAVVADGELALPHGTLTMTASFGVTAKRAEDNSLQDLLYRADQALYRAKREGRNRVCTLAAGSPPDRSEA